MIYEFLKEPMVSISWKVTTIVILIAVVTYIIWADLIGTVSLLLVGFLLSILIFLFPFNQIIVVDTKDLTISNYYRFGKINIYCKGTVNIDLVDRIILNESRYTRTTTSQQSFQSVTGIGYDYDAFLKLKDESSFYLGTSSERESFLDKLDKLAYVLNVQLKDNTSEP